MGGDVGALEQRLGVGVRLVLLGRALAQHVAALDQRFGDRDPCVGVLGVLRRPQQLQRRLQLLRGCLAGVRFVLLLLRFALPVCLAQEGLDGGLGPAQGELAPGARDLAQCLWLGGCTSIGGSGKVR